jgi:hypothetical protein
MLKIKENVTDKIDLIRRQQEALNRLVIQYQNRGVDYFSTKTEKFNQNNKLKGILKQDFPFYDGKALLQLEKPKSDEYVKQMSELKLKLFRTELDQHDPPTENSSKILSKE